MQDGDLVGVQRTLTPVLRAKALDNRLTDPILGDEYAELAMRRLDPAYDRRRFGTSQIGLAAVARAKAHDDWARGFLADHPDAVVLHLGCGLDARVYRIDPPATVDWYDLDYPSVIALRREILPPRDHYTLIDSSVSDLTWLEHVPRGRPVLMIAEGLLPYLTETEIHALLTGVVDAFPIGQIQVDTVSVGASRTSKWDPVGRRYNARFRSGFDNPAALADWHPRASCGSGSDSDFGLGVGSRRLDAGRRLGGRRSRHAHAQRPLASRRRHRPPARALLRSAGARCE